MSLLAFENVTYRVENHILIDRLNFALSAGEMVALLGPNGAGKTSLIKLAAGLYAPNTGQILLDGLPMQQTAPLVRAKKIAYLPQFQNIAWPMAGRDIIALGRLPHHGIYGFASAADIAAIEEAIDKTGVQAYANRPVTQLSGGEQAAIKMARLLAGQTDILLLDEPIQSLDPARQLAIMGLLAAEAKAGKAVLVILHDLTLAARFCARLLLMKEGQIIADGTAEQTLTSANLQAVFNIHAELGKTEKGAYIIPAKALS